MNTHRTREWCTTIWHESRLQNCSTAISENKQF